MKDNRLLPTLTELLKEIDPKDAMDRAEVGMNIATLSLVKAIQITSEELTEEQRKVVEGILNKTENKTDSTKEIIEYLDSISKKDIYLKNLAEATNYWTIDFMLMLYKKVAKEKKELIDVLWPKLGDIADGKLDYF
ncbi:hypothetical protein C4561_02935 [candidate division WWE3 bacterium]|jgi:hypothetical protein|uniref:Uncharacterized protein n=1 Tax=candidate division WWE3 bacterium TaxID=2053526 RepID=A0A3A4ZJR7_UNCKA|nr:MAG: hypothetical protein C4561_02935 [candidate division WWE3 bacterium]